MKEVVIIDAAGRIIQKITLDSPEQKIDVSVYKAGAYFMKFNSPEGSVVKRFMIKQ